MNWSKVLKKAVATTVQAATGMLVGVGTGIAEIEAWRIAVLAGLGGLVAFVHRTSTEYLEREHAVILTRPLAADVPEDPQAAS